MSGLIFSTFLFSTVKPLIVLIPDLALLIPTLPVMVAGGGDGPLVHARDHVNGTDVLAHETDHGQDLMIGRDHMIRGGKGGIGLGPGPEIATNSGVRLIIMH